MAAVLNLSQGTPDASRYDDVLGQLPRLKTYTHLLLCFRSSAKDHDRIIDEVRKAAAQLVLLIPWLAHQVVHIEEQPGSSGSFRLAPCPALAEPESLVRVNDCAIAFPPYDALLAARGPVSMLDGKVLTKLKAFPELYEESRSEPAPVLALQANFIDGGLLLDIAAQHNFIDGGGLLQCTRWLARCLCGGTITTEEREQADCDRRGLIRLLGPDEPSLDHSHLIRESLGSMTASPAPLVSSGQTAQWAFTRFPAASLNALKQKANESIHISSKSTTESTFVSTNDALGAFIWKRLSAVRFARHQDPELCSKFSRALDARRALMIPREYLGQMGYNASCKLSFGQLQGMTLGDTALVMRNKVREVNTAYSVRSWATLIAKEPDKSRIMFGGTFNPATDVGVSSLVHASVHDEVFGLLGKPDLILRPRFSPLEGCVYLWSQTTDGDVDILMCLKEIDIQGLRDDPEWRNSTIFIG